MIELVISDHALVRYIERIKGVPLDEYRDEIRALAAAGQSSAWDREMPALVIEAGNTVVTVLTENMRPKKVGRRLFVSYVPFQSPSLPSRL